MPKNSPRDDISAATRTPARDPFSPGCMVVVSLGSPRDKFWGAVLSLAPAGLSLSGIELASFEDLIAMVRDGEPFTPAVVFFPMHRVERLELDLPDGNLPSLSQRFTAKTGLDPAATLSAPLARLGNFTSNFAAKSGARLDDTNSSPAASPAKKESA